MEKNKKKQKKNKDVGYDIFKTYVCDMMNIDDVDFDIIEDIARQMILNMIREKDGVDKLKSKIEECKAKRAYIERMAPLSAMNWDEL